MKKTNNFVNIGIVDVYDDKVFTKMRAKTWKIQLLDCYGDVMYSLKSKLDISCPIKFALNKSLLDEVIIDAIIGMRKITDSQFNSIESPNNFKIAAYLSYWWLRHKPATIHCAKKYKLDNIILSDKSGDSEYQKCEKEKLIWHLKHINELVAVQMVATYIFDFDTPVCDNRQCSRIKRKEKDKFSFDSFEDMKEVLLKKLTYYFSYRAIAPKVIEHILEGYTFHPAWSLTGEQWKLDPVEGFEDNIE